MNRPDSFGNSKGEPMNAFEQALAKQRQFVADRLANKPATPPSAPPEPPKAPGERKRKALRPPRFDEKMAKLPKEDDGDVLIDDGKGNRVMSKYANI